MVRSVMVTRADGPEDILKSAEERAPDGFINVPNGASKKKLNSRKASNKTVAGFDAENLFKSPRGRRQLAF